MNFYDVAKDYIERMEYLEQGINAETGEMSDDGTQLAIWTDELTQDLKDKSANVIAVVRNQELTIEALDNEIERLKTMKDSIKKKLDKFKCYVKNAMLVNNIERIDTTLGAIKFTKSTTTEIYDESLIDKKFIEVVTTEKISKEKIKAALKAGEEVQGAKLVENKNLKDDIELSKISDNLKIVLNKIYSNLSRDLNIEITNPDEANKYIQDERYKRFNLLIDNKFSDEVLLKLLEYFEKREDKEIEKLVTDEATIPTIFEYILGIIWYKVSERQGNILEFMKLSLEANLLPKTHAAGGYADIIYEYEACAFYPKHSLLLEATLADGNNQRRMEMEPVSRHLGDYRIRFNNPFDYSLFVSTYLDKNVI